jgi:hypothetical protein
VAPLADVTAHPKRAPSGDQSGDEAVSRVNVSAVSVWRSRVENVDVPAAPLSPLGPAVEESAAVPATLRNRIRWRRRSAPRSDAPPGRP